MTRVDETTDLAAGWDFTRSGTNRDPDVAPDRAAATVDWEARPAVGFSLHLDAGTVPGREPPVADARTAATQPIEGADRKATVFPELGQVVGGFRLVSDLGRGAFARVYLAEQAELAARPVALKVSQAVGGEPQALARLQHTHIVPIYSVHDDPETGLRLLCMPYLGGANLAQVLESAGVRTSSEATGRSLVTALERVGGPALASRPAPLGRAATRGLGSPSTVRAIWDRRLVGWGRVGASAPAATGPPALQYLGSHSYIQAAVWIAARLAEALEHAHARGILHRDLKPSNVLLAADGTPMLLDFNLAADALGDGEMARLGGTLPYMAPEHLDAFNPLGVTPPEAVDERSDLYALGLILFEMVAGRHPFADPPAGVPLVEALRRMAEERRQSTPHARAINPQVPPSLDAILAQCLDPDPGRRFARAAHLAEDLRRFLADDPLRHTREPSIRERLAKWVRRHPEVRSASTVGGLGLGLIVTVAAASWSVADRLDAASARVHRAEFQRAFHECQLLLNTTSGPTGHLGRGVARADEALRAYGVDRPGDWTTGPLVRRLPAAEAHALREEMGELVLLRARARIALATGGPAVERRRAVEEAIVWLDRAERFDPRPPAALYDERARDHQALGHADLAARDRQRAARVDPADSRDRYLLGVSWLARREPDRAEPHLNRAVALDPRRFWAWFSLGLCHHDQRRYDAAASDFSVCTVLFPDFAWPHHNRGLALAAAGRLDEARASYDRALALAPQFTEARFNRALACLEMDDPRAALADLDRVVASGRRDPVLLAARAEASSRLGRRAEAARDFNDALLARPDDPTILAARGFSRLRDDPALAEADFARALRHNPQHARALLGQAHVLRPHDSRAALSRVDLALTSAPSSSSALQLRALILAHLGDPSALAAAERLAEVPTPHNLYNAACALSVLSRTTADARLVPRARTLLRRALDAGFPAAGAANDPDLAPLQDHPDGRLFRSNDIE